SDEELAERKTEGVGLTRPELAVLLAWAKIDVKSLLLESEALDDPHFTRELESYFGRELSTRFPDAIAAHPLRRNIVATKVTNSLVNRAGPRFVHQIMEVTGADAADVVRAFVSAREVFGLRRHWLNAEALDDTTTSRVQIGIFRDSVLLLERATRWFLRRCHQGLNVADCVDRFTPGVTEVMETMPELLASHDAARLDKRTAALVANGVPEETARRASVLGLAFPALDIVEVAQELDTELGRAGGVYFRAGERLGLRSLQRAVAAAPIESHWHELARIAAGDEIGQIQKAVCSGALQASPGKGAGTGAVGAWISLHQPAVEQLRRTLAEMRGAGAVDWAMISVALREARRLADLSRGEV
ncbi:MAG: NAD-glutamate dehydrogenase, partial [Thermoanaerobaculia bacterium]|nr:NAD-glutamate dehydrogenase [Thermoanaerobaculia bacterium]